MYLSRLELRDFRNWARLDLTLPEGMVIFHGANGAGKTNLLEAPSGRRGRFAPRMNPTT